MTVHGDVMDIGAHCANEECNQLDFLPLSCSKCDRTFCKDCFSSHGCSLAGPDSGSVVVCPMCARGVERKPGVDPNVLIEEHQRQGRCDPKNYKRVHNRQRCFAVGCREKLTTVNAYECRHCNQKTCVRHRFREDHGCTGGTRPLGRKASGSGAPMSSFVKSIKSFFSQF